jgi:hypothetical protein
MTGGAHVRPEPIEALPHVRPSTRRRRAADQIELEAIREAFDREWDAKHHIPFEVVARICRTYAAELVKRGGRL